MSDNIVVKAENIARAAVWSDAVSWYDNMYAKLVRFFQTANQMAFVRVGDSAPVLSYDMHAMRGDASNSNQWRSHKVFCSEVWSCAQIPELDNAALKVGREWKSSLCYPDLCWVPTHHTGQSQMEMWEEKLEQQGVRTWKSHAEYRALWGDQPSAEVE